MCSHIVVCGMLLQPVHIGWRQPPASRVVSVSSPVKRNGPRQAASSTGVLVSASFATFLSRRSMNGKVRHGSRLVPAQMGRKRLRR
jgi:hypothetical protein